MASRPHFSIQENNTFPYSTSFLLKSQPLRALLYPPNYSSNSPGPANLDSNLLILGSGSVAGRADPVLQLYKVALQVVAGISRFGVVAKIRQEYKIGEIAAGIYCGSYSAHIGM